MLWHSLEMLQWGASNEYQQLVFMEKYEKQFPDSHSYLEYEFYVCILDLS